MQSELDFTDGLSLELSQKDKEPKCRAADLAAICGCSLGMGDIQKENFGRAEICDGKHNRNGI